ncbi:MAG: discoidin domain-containing protein [Rubrivivax sp.]|nr:discoidin domain-containing protein [Rubrivivax sp.]
MRCWPIALLLAAGTVGAATLRSEMLDDFRDTAAWQASASDQVRASLRRDRDGSLCLDYDFAGVSGYAVMRRALPMDWPHRFDLGARIKGSGATNDLQFKLVDASGDNVWWVNRPNTALPARLAETKFRSRHVQFAWGPAADKSLRRTQFVEFVIAAGRDGGKGALCVASLHLQERAPDPQPWPAVHTTSTAGRTAFDFGRVREFNGVALQWPAGAKALDYDLQASDDGSIWRTVRRVRGSDGGLDALFLPESEARHLRVALRRGSASPQLTLKSAADWPDFNRVLATLAADAPRGELPRAFLGQQNYWTLVGVDGGGQRSALLSEDGALEIGRGGYSLEPTVQLEDGRRVTWADVKASHTLREGHLPLPAVHWAHPSFTLDVEATADGTREAPQLLGRYTLRNRSTQAQRFTLQVALRPWQVNPPQQFLSTPGGASPVQALRWNGRGLAVDGRPPLRFTALPQTVGALPFDSGLSLTALQAAQRPSTTTLDLRDPQAHASALLEWSVTLAPGASHTVGLVAPLGTQPATAASPGQLQARFDAAATHWRERLSRVTLQLPGDGTRIADTLATSLAHMLMSRDGPALRPGTRSYARTWIRDGAMMVAGLLRLGEVDAAREFTDWYAGFVFNSGKVPCCVDQRGADPVVENDSHGQYLYAVAEVLRHTGHIDGGAWAERHWPTVQRVMTWMEALRQSERTTANRTPERAHFFGLMPPSISHEGYSDKAAYSYWDDFWALRGYKDAVQLAQRGGHAAEAARWAGWRDEFERELAASIEATARHWNIDFIAGAADRGDFDATSTTMALNPAQAAVSRARLDATFERYWQEMNARAEGRRAWKDYTPYELRTVGALARLGQPARAHAMLDFFFKDQRPAGWNQWAEVVLPDAREPRFLGDMPHAWVSSDYIRSALDLLVYDDEGEHSLVLGAGLKAAWLQQGDVVLRGLSTPYGRLDWSLRRSARGWQLDLPSKMSGLHGGARLRWPEGLALPRALHGGQALAWQGRDLVLPAAPVQIELVRE